MDVLTIVLLIVSVVTLAAVFYVILKSGRHDPKSVSADDLERLERKISEEERCTRAELAAGIDKFRAELTSTTESKFETLRQSVENRFDSSMDKFQKNFDRNTSQMVEAQRERFAELDKRQQQLVEATEKKLEEMRVTVDEKLQKTLNERLGKSFQLVGEQLENVQRGLGEMKNLAADVGGLKNALTNVKVRGNFGELQLEALLAQMLSPEQYDKNVATVKNSAERVEFALKLPGNDSDGTVYLPIDSKFPKDVYDQYVDAVDNGDADLVKSRSAQLETTIRSMAKDISTKYISVPDTTNFAIMFVPVENIYAEVIRRTELMRKLRDEYSVLVTGPTTLGALLSSLQMGFKTLAIQKRSNEVWKTLGAVKSEFQKFETLLEKAQKNIQTAYNNLDELKGTRSRAINRQLKNVESLPDDKATELLSLSDVRQDDAEE